ncbi:MAG: outer membrane lipoprotein-sorting protein [Oligoflexia bacterium]|nr:outer membrane lipoprotein-sorting protein [Oligoflexia bacterium]
MKGKIKKIIFVSMFAIAATTLWYLKLELLTTVVAEEKKPDVKKILDSVDRLYRSNHSFATMEMRIETPDWKRTLEMNVWALGLEKTFIRILSPQKDKGIATLRIKNEMWNFFPKIDKSMKVPPSMMMGSWMGSDFTNDDLVKESTFIKDYDSKLIDYQFKNKDNNYYYIELRPKEKTATVWEKIIVVIKKDNFNPLRQEYYDDKDVKVREIIFKDVKTFGNKTIPSVMELTPLNKIGHKTIIEYKDLKFDKVDESIFSHVNLQKRI